MLALQFGPYVLWALIGRSDVHVVGLARRKQNSNYDGPMESQMLRLPAFPPPSPLPRGPEDPFRILEY